MCHRACCTGHRQLLVFFWTGSYFAADPDRRAGCHHRCCFLCHFIRTEISLMQRSTMQDAISAPKIGGIVRLTKFSVQGTLFIELLGMTAMLPVFFRDYGIKGIWMAAFHSVSAFCNAGFDLLGTSSQPFVSLGRYIANPLINLVIMLLIIIGGIGFLTWDDICTHKWHIRRYRVQSKVILWTSALLIIIPAVFFLLWILRVHQPAPDCWPPRFSL